jgi:hypothetical protein
VVKKLDKSGAVLIGKLAIDRAGRRRWLPLRQRFLDWTGIEPVGQHAVGGRIVQRAGSGACGGVGALRIGSKPGIPFSIPARVRLDRLASTYGYVSRAGAMALSWHHG